MVKGLRNSATAWEGSTRAKGVPCQHERSGEPALLQGRGGREAKLSYMGHAIMENRHGLAVAGKVTKANGTAERRASETILKALSKAVGHGLTAGEDKAYDTSDHVAALRAANVTAHAAKNNIQRDDSVRKTISPSRKPARSKNPTSTRR